MVLRAYRRRALILLLVEGPSDRDALPILARKIAGHSLKALPVGKGDLFQPGKLEIHVQFARHQHPSISKVFLCVDSECTPIEDTQHRTRSLEATLAHEFPSLAIRYIIVDHSLEGWFMVDRGALRKVLGKESWLPKKISSFKGCRPARDMERIFHRNKRDFIKKRDDKRLAEEINIGHVRRMCETFQYFAQTVSDP